jgi:hypothetical protein
MPYTATVYNVMIASPSDVTTERRIAQEVIYKWNATHSGSRKIILRPLAWEFDTFPELGDRPQGIINKYVLQKSDLLVAIFWTRLGSPTGQSISGTVEEIEEHKKAGKAVMLYFSEAPSELANVDPQQYEALKRFRKEIRGLFETFKNAEDFRDKFRDQLARSINEHTLFANTQGRAAQLVEKSDVYGVLIEVAKRAPGLAIESAWPYVQDSLLALGRKAGLREQGTWDGGPVIPIAEFDRIGSLPAELIASIKNLETLRIKVAQVSDFKPSTEDAEKFVLLASRAVLELNQITPE